QDAYLYSENSIKNIIDSFKDEKIGAVCGRQIPHLDADPFAKHARYFNYPKQSSIKTYEDRLTIGIKVPFMSNSFSAYRREALLGVGGFPSNVILAEDMYVAAKMACDGWKIAY